uniref:Putative helicase n=1 Tax=viral metagenome TaxID=1070528 RepID=A0A6M3KU79_9ZZZZ
MSGTETPEEFVRRVYSKTTRVGANEVRFPCPACHNEEGFSFNTKTGLWMCMRASCEAAGNLYKIKVLLGEAYDVETPDKISGDMALDRIMSVIEAQVTEDRVDKWRRQLLTSPDAEAARRYLISRRIGPNGAAAAQARLGWERSKRSAQGVIMIPYPMPGKTTLDSEIPLVKTRYIPPEPVVDGKLVRYHRLPDGTSVPYTPLGLGVDKPALVVGGELDALSVLQAYVDGGVPVEEIPVYIVAPPSESSWKVVVAGLQRCEEIVVVFDSDEAGQSATEKLSYALGTWRTRSAVWPGGCNDANAALQADLLDVFALADIVQNSRPVAAKGVAGTMAFESRVLASLDRQKSSWSTGFVAVDRLIGGLRPGETTLITGHTGSGKSVFVSNLVVNQVACDHTTFFCPFELGVEKQILRSVTQLLETDVHKMTADEVRGGMRTLGNHIMWFDHYGSVNIQLFRETLMYVVRTLMVDLVVLDHRDFMVQRGKDRWDKLDELCMMVVQTIKDTQAHCIMVVHPGAAPKAFKRDSDDWLPQLGDVKGHSDAIQDVDNVASMYRPRSANRTNAAEADGTFPAAIVFTKVRDPHGDEGTVELRFNKNTLRFSDLGCNLFPY